MAVKKDKINAALHVQKTPYLCYDIAAGRQAVSTFRVVHRLPGNEGIMFAMLRRNLILICTLLSLISLAPRPALAQITSLDFGSVPGGQSSSQVLTKTLYLSGIYTSANINTPYITGPDKADFKIIQDGFTGGPYSNGAMLSVTISFTPSRTGPEQATLDGSGTVQPGNAPLTFVPVTLTGTGVPPVTVSAAKIGAANLATSLISGLNCGFPSYYKGQGTGIITGKWLVDGKDYQDETLTLQGLSDGWHTGPTLTIAQSMLLGSHTVQFVLNAPGSPSVSTGITNCSISGFEPAKNGWRFNNTGDTSRAGIESLATNGVCVGMSVIAASDYPNIPIPIDAPPTPLEWNEILKAQLTANGAETAVNLRLFSYLFDSSDQMSSETDLLRIRLMSGNPWVMFLFKQSGPIHHGITSHAVVPFALFDTNNAYVTANPDTQENVHTFAIYDPDAKGVVSYLDEYELTGTYTMNYGPYVNIASFESRTFG